MASAFAETGPSTQSARLGGGEGAKYNGSVLDLDLPLR